MTPDEQLAGDIAGFTTDPLGFARYVFPWGEPGTLERFDGPYDWQADILATIGKHLQSKFRYEPLKIAVASGRGIGKSALISIITNWALSTCDDSRVVVTANTEPQLATKTWPEINKWFRRAVNDHWWTHTATRICIRDPKHADNWRVDRETWSEHNVEAFRGLHNQGKRMVIIFDEAAGIPDAIWEATEGSLTDEGTEMLWLAFSNPSQNTGRFRECFGRYKHRWVTRQIDSRNVAGTNSDEIERWIEDYGADSDFVRINVKGEFPRAASNQFIAGDVVQAARQRTVDDQSKAWKILSVDVARFGDDQTVIGYRQGLKCVILDRLRGMSTDQVAMRTMMWIAKENPRTCVIDGDGIGGAVVDYIELHHAEWMKKHPNFRLEEFHGGHAPSDAFMYFNRRAEVWGTMRDWLLTGEIPDDPELDADLTGPEYFHSNKNQIQLERKDDMKARGLNSPDTGDMLAMTFGVTPLPKSADEELTEQLKNTKDPMEQHFIRLRETERRQKPKQLNYWE